MSDFTIRGIPFTKDIALACIIDGSISDCHIEQYEDAPILLKGIFYNKDFSNPAAVNKYLHILLADLIEFVEDQTMGESTTKFPQDAVCRIKVSDESYYEDKYIGVFWNLAGIGETSVLPDYYIAKLINFANWEQNIHISDSEEKEESIHDDIRIESIRVFSSKYKNHEGDGVLMARNEILYAIEDNEIVRYRIRNISVQNKDNETKYCFEVVNFDSSSLESKTLYEDDLGVTLFGSYNKAKEKLSKKDFFKQAFVLIPKGNNNVHLYIDGEEYIAASPVLPDNGECTRIDITGAINFAINERLGKDK